MKSLFLRDVEGAVPYERGVGDFVEVCLFWGGGGRRPLGERGGGFCLGLFFWGCEGAFHPDVCPMRSLFLRDVEGAVPYESE